MNITIIGSGNMARGIATRALAGNNAVTILGHHAEGAVALADDLNGDIDSGVIGDPIRGDIVVLATPYDAVADVLTRYEGQFDGKVVVDITNPVDFSTFTPLTLAAGSAAQEIAAKVPSAQVAKAFNTTFAGTLIEGQVAGQPLDVLVAADDEDTKRAVGELVESGGMRAVDAGPLARAHELEALGYLHMALQDKLGTGFGSTVKLLA